MQTKHGHLSAGLMQIQRTCNEKASRSEYMTLMLTSGESTDRRGGKREAGNNKFIKKEIKILRT